MVRLGSSRGLDEIKALEKGGRFAADEIRRRYGEFAKEYADTPQGRTIAEWLKATEPKIAEVPKPVEPKTPEPPPEPKSPEPAPVVKPPAPAPPTPAPSPRPQDTRKPVPDAAKIREAEAALRKAFKIDQAKSPAEKAALARELLQTAAISGAKDAELYVFLANARDLAAQAADAKTAMEAVEAMAASFEVDAIGEKTAILTKASLGPSSGTKGQLTLDLGGGARMELIYIKPGVFTMGGTEAPREGWQGDERPPHEVEITRGFHIGKYEVTRGQFGAFVGAIGYKAEAERQGNAWGRRPDGRWEVIKGNNWRIMGGTTGIRDGRRTRWGRRRQTHGASLICTGTYGSGARIGLHPTVGTRGILKAPRAGIAGACGAGTGVPTRSTADPRSGASTIRPPAARSRAFGWRRGSLSGRQNAPSIL